MDKHKLIIVGSGPAGLTAAIYAARASLKPVIFEGYQAGGQLMITSEVENFPGFKDGINGPELMAAMRAQAERFGAHFITSDVTGVELSAEQKRVSDDEQELACDALIIATGASANFLGLEKEKALMGRGVSACATCDGFFFTGKTVCVVGGGDSAMEEATFLTRFAEKVFLIHRRDEFRASAIMVQRASDNPKIEFILNSTVVDIVGEERVTGVTLKNTKTNKTSQLKVDGMFVAIGHTPNTGLFKNQLEMDEKGYITTSADRTKQTHTNIPGVFACGDVQDYHYRQAISAAGSGCMAAMDAEQYLEEMYPGHMVAFK